MSHRHSIPSKSALVRRRSSSRVRFAENPVQSVRFSVDPPLVRQITSESDFYLTRDADYYKPESAGTDSKDDARRESEETLCNPTERGSSRRRSSSSRRDRRSSMPQAPPHAFQYGAPYHPPASQFNDAKKEKPMPRSALSKNPRFSGSDPQPGHRRPSTHHQRHRPPPPPQVPAPVYQQGAPRRSVNEYNNPTKPRSALSSKPRYSADDIEVGRRRASHQSRRRPGLTPTPAASQTPEVPKGFLGGLAHAFHNFTKDQEIPSRAPSRRNSFCGVACTRKSLTNFEQSLVINEPVEETYLVDEKPEKDKFTALPIFRPALAPTKGQTYRERRKKKKHVIVYCMQPVEEYQRFIIALGKALLAFGSPSHRIEAQLHSLARVFEIEAQFHHVPGAIQISFGRPEEGSSDTRFITRPVCLALSRIHTIHNIYRAVLHDEMYASKGTKELCKLLKAKPRYGPKTQCVLAFFTCMLICGIAFSGSLNDMWVAGVMGFIVCAIQIRAATSQLSAGGSEIFSAALVALVARALSSYYTQIWCFTSISSAGIIAMLPGFLILSGTLDIAGRNSTLGSPKIVAGVIASLYLEFGLSLGSDIFLLFDKAARHALNAAAAAATPAGVTFAATFSSAVAHGNGTTPFNHLDGAFKFSNVTVGIAENIVQGCFRDPEWPWYLQPLPQVLLIFLVPIFAFCASMGYGQHWWSWQMLIMVVNTSVSFFLTRAAYRYWGFANNPDYVSFFGSFCIGIVGNAYSRKFGGTAFTAMLTGVLLLVPEGLAAGGGIAVNYQQKTDGEYVENIDLARRMIIVTIGIMAGVYSSAGVVYMFGKKKNAALVTF